MAEFEPRILGFLCNWCSYAGADLCGVSRFQYPPNIRIVRVMCSGRVDPVFVIEGLLSGADGVLVLGCHTGECHYSVGNYEAINMVRGVRKLLDQAGINRDRLMLDWVSASEGTRFSELVSSFTRQIKLLGPLGTAEGKSPAELRFVLEAAKGVVESEKVRYLISKQTDFVKEGNEYGEQFTRHELDRALEGTIADALIESEILLLLKEKPLSVKDIVSKMNVNSPEVLKSMVSLRKKGKAALSNIEGTSPLYCAVRKEGEQA